VVINLCRPTAGRLPAAAFQSVDWEKALSWLKTKTGADLAPEQASTSRSPSATRFPMS
jgi:exodeoxyribonuclease V alpha subunit